MAFNPINFANIETQGNPFFRDLIENLSTGYQAGQLPAQLERKRQQEEIANAFKKLQLEEEPKKFGEESQGRQLENALNKFKVQQEPQRFGSEQSTAAFARALSQANTNKINTLTPLEATDQSLKNAWYPKLSQSTIDSQKELAKLRASGVSGLGTGGREEMLFQNLIAKDNPNLTPEQSYEASNALREGRNTLVDGTKINPLSPAAQASFDRLTRYGTTGTLVTNAKLAAQAEKEMGVLGKYITKAIAPYGDTIAGYSPEQIMATFSNKKEDQLKLGKLAAAQQLQVDFAAIQNRLNSGQSTASITNEILDSSELKIKTQWPRMSNIARQEAMRYLTEALREGLKARQAIRLGASSTNTPENPTNSNEAENVEDEQVVDGKHLIKIKGEWYHK
jgi:hypothetical protein